MPCRNGNGESHYSRKTKSRSEKVLFFRRWLANPLKVGAVLPSSQSLARKIARLVEMNPDEAIVELGAGTGALTQALFDRDSLNPERLFIIEIDPKLCSYLRARFPGAQVINGDAGRVQELLPTQWIGRVSTLVSGLPMLNFPAGEKRRLIDSWSRVATPKATLVQYTYALTSPIPHEETGLVGECDAVAYLNLPPASVWRYTLTPPMQTAAD